MQDYVVGVVLSVLASFAASIGDNTIKLAYSRRTDKRGGGRLFPDRNNEDTGVEDEECPRNDEEDIKGEELGPVYKDPLFLFGNFCLAIINTVLNMISMAFVDASVTIPFGGLHIVFNVPLALIINREHSSLRVIALNALIFFSVVIILLSGNREPNEVTVEDLHEDFIRPPFAVASGVVLGLMFYAWKALLSKDANTRRLGMTIGAGLVGSITQIFAKSMSLCIKEGAWDSQLTYAFIGATALFGIWQGYALNRCLDLYSATFTVPIVNSVIIVVGSLYSAVFFREVERWEWKSRIFVPLGILLCAISIAALSNDPDLEERRGPAMSESELSPAGFEQSFIAHEPAVAAVTAAPPNVRNDEGSGIRLLSEA